MRKAFFIIFQIMLSGFAATAQDNSITAYGGEGAIFIYHAFHPASAAYPNNGVTGYKLEREDAGVQGRWVMIRDFHTPKNIDELVRNLRASFRFFPDGKKLRLDPPAIWKKFLSTNQTLDSLSNELDFTAMQMAFNILVADTTVVKGKTYRYRVSEVGTGGTSFITNNVKYPAVVTALKPHILSRKVESEAIRLEWFAKNDNNSFNFKTFRKAEGDKVFEEIHPFVYMERKGDTLKYSIRDEHVAFSTMYRYFIMPVNNFGGGGNVVSDTIPATCMEARGLLTPQYFKAVGDELTHTVKLHYHLPNPGFIGSVAVMRSTSYDDGGYKQVGLAMPYDTVYSDFRIEAGQKYYYYLQMVDKMGRTTVRSAKTFGLYQTKINNFPPRAVTAILKGGVVLVNWEMPVEKQSGFYVYRSEGVGMPMKRLSTMLAANSYTDSSRLRPGIMYGYAVRSENASNVESKNSTIAYIQAATVDSVLMAPKNFHAELQGQAVRLTWMQMLKLNKFQTGYRITRHSDGDKRDVVIRNALPAPFSTFVDSTAVPGITYIYNIESTAGKAHSMQVPSNAITVTPMRYIQPGGLMALSGATGIKLKWGAINDKRVTRFAIYRYKRGAAAKLIATVPSATNTYVDKAATKGDTWYFYIRSIGKNVAETSEKSNEAFVSF